MTYDLDLHEWAKRTITPKVYVKGHFVRKLLSDTHRDTHRRPTALYGHWVFDNLALSLPSISSPILHSSAVLAVALCLSVYHKPALYRNGWADPAYFWQNGFFRPILHNILEKLGYLQKIRIAFFPSELCRKLWTQKILPRHVDCRKCCQHNLDTQCDKQAIVVGRTKMSIYLQRSTHTRRAGPSAQLISVFSLPLNPFYPPASRSSTRLLSTASSL